MASSEELAAKAEKAKAKAEKLAKKLAKAEAAAKADEEETPKKEKKEKKEKSEKKKKRKHESDEEGSDADEEKKEKKEKKARKDPERAERRAAEKAAAAAESDEDEPAVPRRRTRSQSFAEEQDAAAKTPEAFRAESDIRISGPLADGTGEYACPDPFQLFESTPFVPALKKCLSGAGFIAPTATQAQTWPICLQGRDVISVAKTGSGKTLGFLLPAFHQLMDTPEQQLGQYHRGNPKILVMAPTRELACQIHDDARKFGAACGIRSTCVYGGAPKRAQIGDLMRNKPEIVVGTPGRLNDLIEIQQLNVAEVVFLVLDEADRMLDMGFEPQIREIIKYIPEKRQTLFFTATWPREVRMLAGEFLRHPITVEFGDRNKLNANKDVKQIIQIVEEHEKMPKILELLKTLIDGSADPSRTGHVKMIVFCSQKTTCSRLANDLWKQDKAVDSLHGDR